MAKIRLALLVLVFVATSCTDATQAKIGGYGDEFLVELINCDGTVSRAWTSTGKVRSEEKSDGYFFMDKETGKLIEVTGVLIITKK